MSTTMKSYLDQVLTELNVDPASMIAADTDLVIDQFDGWTGQSLPVISPTSTCWCQTDSSWVL